MRDDGTARYENWIAAGLCAVHLLILLYLTIFRYIDRDEGFYLSAAWHVAQGHTLYADFFFPQMPLLPYLLSLVSGHGFDSLYLSRYIGLLPAAATAVLLFLTLRLVTSRPSTRLLLMFGYCLAGVVLVWHSVAKTYVWTDLWLLLLFFALLKWREKRQTIWLILAGICFGLAINFRSVLIVTFLPALYAMASDNRKRLWSSLAVFAAAVLAVSIPAIRLLIADPQNFYFDNLGFHFVRNPGVNAGAALLERGEALGKFIINPQTWLVMLGLMVAFRRGRLALFGENQGFPFRLALQFAGVITLVYLLPSPVHVQYFEQALPFALLAAVPGFDYLAGQGGSRRWYTGRTAVILGAAVYMVALAPFAVIFLGGVRKDDAPYRLRNMTELCRFVREYPAPGPVMSEWAGVPVLSGRDGLAGLEYIGFEYPLPMSSERQRRYRLPVNSDLNRLLEQRVPALYVVWNQPDSALQLAASANYYLVGEFGQFKVLARKESSP